MWQVIYFSIGALLALGAIWFSRNQKTTLLSQYVAVVSLLVSWPIVIILGFYDRRNLARGTR